MSQKLLIHLFSIAAITFWIAPIRAQDSDLLKADTPLTVQPGDELKTITPRPDVFLIDDGISQPRPKDASEKAIVSELSEEERDSNFEKLLTGARLRGQFTMDGKPLTDLQDETYEIKRVQKLNPKGDTWAIHSRIKYGEHDLVVPVPIKVKWAGSTPVLTMDNMMVPGLGTFSARVVLHGNRYAGTWQHDDVGGHLFGVIEVTDEASEESSDNNETKEAQSAQQKPE